MKGKRIKWDEVQVEFLKDNYSKKTVREIANQLGLTELQVRKKVVSLGMTKKKDDYKFQQWDKKDIQVLKDNYHDKTVKEICNLLNNKFTEKQVRNKIAKLDLRKSNSWNEELIHYLLNNYQSMSVEEMREDRLTNFTTTAIYKKLYSLGYKIDSNVKWSIDEEELLKKQYSNYTNNEIQQMIPRFTIKQIKNKAHQLGLRKNKLTLIKSHQNSNVNKWSDEEKSILINHYSNMPTKELMEIHLPNRSIDGIKTVASRLGLSKNNNGKFYWNLTSYKVEEDAESSVTLTFRKESAK